MDPSFSADLASALRLTLEQGAHPQPPQFSGTEFCEVINIPQVPQPDGFKNIRSEWGLISFWSCCAETETCEDRPYAAEGEGDDD
eukprot:CAMPEP_0172671292 /NCGR_PEP_ID=MMETSP1074-20121228/10828_1 /TAXON_ID=2916 /ORGANISM="Ceratium fusus, Strain PA161109" /LENGTH=84 /DNA_ID=CAMNT_0013488315 /DNA_START=265 /DNA_END=519 /DNA_ORIENTATION=-